MSAMETHTHTLSNCHRHIKFTCLAFGLHYQTSAPFILIHPLCAIFWPSSIKGQIHSRVYPRGYNEVSCQTAIMQLPYCCIWWPLVSCFTQSNANKGPFDALPFSNQSTPFPDRLQHLFQCNLILHSVQPDPIDKLNLSEPAILMPPWGKWLCCLIFAFFRSEVVSLIYLF